MHRFSIIFFATLAVLANATDILWSPCTLNLANRLPTSRNISIYTANLSKVWAHYTDFSWSSNFTGDCMSVTLSPSSGKSISSVNVQVFIDWRVFKWVTLDSCYIQATTSTGETSLLQIRIHITSTDCNYQPDPIQFCRKKFSESDTIRCDHFGSCVHYEPDSPRPAGLSNTTIAIITVASIVGVALIWIVVAVLIRECKARRQRVDADSYQLLQPQEY